MQQRQLVIRHRLLAAKPDAKSQWPASRLDSGGLAKAPSLPVTEEQAMQNEANTTLTRVPWNKGKVIGAKRPLRPEHVWSTRTKLQIEGCVRDLAMFNLAIDSKLRGCDVVATKVEIRANPPR
jgi:hypothetical protein